MKIDDKIEGIIDEAEHFVDAKVETIRLETVEKTVNISASMLSWLLIFSVALIGVGLLSAISILALAMFMSYLKASIVVFAVLFVFILILLKFKDKLLIRPIKNYLLGEYIKSNEPL